MAENTDSLIDAAIQELDISSPPSGGDPSPPASPVAAGPIPTASGPTLSPSGQSQPPVGAKDPSSSPSHTLPPNPAPTGLITRVKGVSEETYRRRRVNRLHKEGFDPIGIAEVLQEDYPNISEKEILSDLAKLKRQGLRRAESRGKDAAADIITDYDYLQGLALQEFREAAPGSGNRAKFLDVARQVVNEKSRFLQSLGNIEKQVQVTEIRHKHGVLPEHLSPDMVRQLEGLLVGAAMGELNVGSAAMGLLSDGEVIEAEVVSVSSSDEPQKSSKN